MHACMHARLRVPAQEKMSQFANNYEELEFLNNRYYAKLQHENKGCFEKLYSRSGNFTMFPKVLKHLREEQEASLGPWM